MKEIEIEIKYEKLYFNDIVYIFNSIKETTKKFYMEDKVWHDERIIAFFRENKIPIPTTQYYEAIPIFKTIIRRGVAFEIQEWKKGSLKIKASFVISDTILMSLISMVNIPAGITVGLILKLALLIYSQNEEEYDKKLNKMKQNWKKQAKKRDKRKRGIDYQIIRIR